MADVDHEAEFDEAFKGFGEDPVTPPVTPPAEPPKDDPTPPPEPPKPSEKEDDNADKNKPTDKAEDTTKPDDSKPVSTEGDKPTGSEEKPTDGKPTEPATPPVSEEPKPLTEDSVRSIISEIRTDERSSAKEIENTTKEVMDAYYPDGLSNVLTTPEGKELRTPQDVVDASGGEMDIEQATQWLMNEQFKLDKQISEINADAQKIAETTVNFKRDSIAALQKYEPLFKAYPQLQKKAFDLLMKQVKADDKKGVILSAPDVMDLYDTYLEPYQQAYEYSTKQPATNPVPAPNTPPAPSPGADDRLDEGGDGGPAPVDDPNDFAQQVNKELAKGI